jgi:hypothetical protein
MKLADLISQAKRDAQAKPRRKLKGRTRKRTARGWRINPNAPILEQVQTLYR